MKQQIQIMLSIALLSTLTNCNGQIQTDKKPTAVEADKGKVLAIDGRTPAPHVIVYYWHTDDEGLYTPNDQTPELGTKHGRLRGWVRSDEYGQYMIKTSHPAAYPDQDIPQHIHLSIKEPDIADEYYTTLYFDDDPLYLAYKKKHGTDDRAELPKAKRCR